MEVLKRGRIPKFKVTCPECGTEFTHTRGEAVYAVLHSLYLVRCPVCDCDCKTSFEKYEEVYEDDDEEDEDL